MKFLAIDTSAKYLSVVAYNGGEKTVTHMPDCALRHSVVLMDTIDKTFAQAHLSPEECDFFAVCVGPGSFTGIRIGISAVKGLCLAADKPALAVTSFDTVAYDMERDGEFLALVDAGHGAFYGCPYARREGILTAGEPAFLPAEEMEALKAGGRAFRAAGGVAFASSADPAEGLYRAVLNRAGETIPASALSALYLRKSSAEEGRK